MNKLKLPFLSRFTNDYKISAKSRAIFFVAIKKYRKRGRSQIMINYVIIIFKV